MKPPTIEDKDKDHAWLLTWNLIAHFKASFGVLNHDHATL